MLSCQSGHFLVGAFSSTLSLLLKYHGWLDAAFPINVIYRLVGASVEPFRLWISASPDEKQLRSSASLLCPRQETDIRADSDT